MQQIALEGQYDWVALAGSALALTGFPHRAAATTFWDQLRIAHHLHGIQQVVIIDHQDCGAYTLKLGYTLSQDPEREQDAHRYYLQAAATAIQRRYPDLQIATYFASLNGEVLALD